MNIVYLGWRGALIWDSRSLPALGEWEADGPDLPVEFARETSGARMTLVIVDQPTPVPTLWASRRSSELKTVAAKSQPETLPIKLR